MTTDEKWSIPLPQKAIDALRARLVKKGVPVRFLNEKGETVDLVTGETQGRHVHVMYKTHYWNFSEETIQLIEARTGLRGVRSDDA